MAERLDSKGSGLMTRFYTIAYNHNSYTDLNENYQASADVRRWPYVGFVHQFDSNVDKRISTWIASFRPQKLRIEK